MTTYSVDTKTSSAELKYDDCIDIYFIDASSGDIDIKLPPIKYDGMRWVFKRIDSSDYIITFHPYSGDNIDTPSTLTAGQSVQYVSLISTNTWYAFYL